MIRWYFENVFEEESVQFSEIPEDNQFGDRNESHIGTTLIEPSNVSPISRCELEDGTSNFAGRRLNIFDTFPFIGTHLQLLANVHSKPNAQAIANQHIKYQCIPPALNEIGQQMCKCNLGDLPSDTDRPTDAIVSDQNGLHCPAQKVTQRKRIQMIIQFLSSDVRTVCSIFL